ncbi:MAG: twin-arginine translocase TatA/TatE family subunit [Ilumatobacteraceae bacterium]
MFNLSGSEIIFLLVIGLVVLGPEKLPGALRKAGRVYGEFKRITSGAESEFRSAFAEPLRELQDTASSYKTMFTDAASGMTKAASNTVSEVKSSLGEIKSEPESSQLEIQPKNGNDIVDGM